MKFDWLERPDFTFFKFTPIGIIEMCTTFKILIQGLKLPKLKYLWLFLTWGPMGSCSVLFLSVTLMHKQINWINFRIHFLQSHSLIKAKDTNQPTGLVTFCTFPSTRSSPRIETLFCTYIKKYVIQKIVVTKVECTIEISMFQIQLELVRAFSSPRIGFYRVYFCQNHVCNPEPR